jgi:hypothetical protein
MAEQQPDTNYPVLVTARSRGFDLRIQELLLVVRGPDLQKAYDELLERKRQVIDWARAIGSFDELPPPNRPPLFGVTADRSSRGPASVLSWPRGAWKKIF